MIASARAQNYDFNAIPEIPDYNEMSLKDYVTQSFLVKEKPEGDTHLAFQVRLPNAWTRASETATAPEDMKDKKSATTGLNRKLLGEIARYVGPAMNYEVSRFEVEAIDLDHDMTARDWFLNYVLGNSLTLQGLNVRSTSEVEALYVVVEKDQTFVVRTLAQINGKRMILASYYSPDIRWPVERGFQENALRTFRFLNPEELKIATLKTYTYMDLAKFDYPSSWKLQPPQVYGLEGMDAKLVSSLDKRTLNGEIDIFMISRSLQTTLAEEVKYIREDLDGTGLKIGKLIETPEKLNYGPQLDVSTIEVYEAKGQKEKLIDYELWFAVMTSENYYYVVTMLTPTRQADFYPWARNKEAFQTVLESFRELI
jgi:hypothetical protein